MSELFETLRLVAGAGYLIILTLLVPFGAHRLRLLWLRWRSAEPVRPVRWAHALPRVAVQLPVYNEANVVDRLLDAACRLDYPTDRLEIQLLDDSDDETTAIARRRVRHWRARGLGVEHVRRGTRDGFKAGALAEGVRRSDAEFFLVLDADFVADPDLIRRLLPSFADPETGAVQAAWDHLNPDDSWLTRAQALFLDAHFAVEHAARYRAGLFFNFNGSAGMWRRECLESAGGWCADTLTEDLDLSYRAQLAGWRFAYLDDVRVYAELPPRLRSLELQQERWAQGGIQTARKLLPTLWRSAVPARIKIEGTAHLLGHAVHPVTLTLGVALAAAGLLGQMGDFIPRWVHAVALGFATVPFVLFYGAAAHLRGTSVAATARRIPEAMLLGLALGIPLTGAVLRGLAGTPTPFYRTPKRGLRPRRRYSSLRSPLAFGVRAVLGCLLAIAAIRLAGAGLPVGVAFTMLFALGYLGATRETLRREPVPQE